MIHFRKLMALGRRAGPAAAGTLLAAATVLAGTAQAGAVPSPPRLVFTPPSGVYGQAAVGSRAAKKFTLANQGGSATGMLTLRKSGPGRAAFTIAANTCAATSLGPRKTCTFTVRFHPTSPVGYAATLTATGKNPASSSHLYWANVYAGTIVEAGLDGSNPHVIAAGQDSPAGVAVSTP
jgi:hypothetical protein